MVEGVCGLHWGAGIIATSLLSKQQVPLEMAGREVLQLIGLGSGKWRGPCDGLDTSAELWLHIKLTRVWWEFRSGSLRRGGEIAQSSEDPPPLGWASEDASWCRGTALGAGHPVSSFPVSSIPLSTNPGKH